MLFSIVIPVYNCEDCVIECLESIRKQDFDDYEVICINDGSTDASLKLVHDFSERDGRFSVISQENKGVSSARNNGLSYVRGEWVLFVDSDDMIAGNMLSSLAGFCHDGRYDMISFEAEYVTEGGGIPEGPESTQLTRTERDGWDFFEHIVTRYSKISTVTVWSKAYRTSFLKDNDLSFKEGIYHEDNLFIPLACSAAGKVLELPDIFYYYRIRTGSIMHSNTAKHAFDMAVVANELGSRFMDNGRENGIIYSYILTLYRRSILYSDKNTDKDLRSRIDWKTFRGIASRRNMKNLISYYLTKVSPPAFRRLYTAAKAPSNNR